MPPETSRRFLFLQGPLSPLYRRLGRRLAEEGHEVARVNFCLGDWIHWHGRGTRSYRGRPEDWARNVGDLLDRLRITDLVVHGDRRFYHRVAIEAAAMRGVRVIATELGYLRPGWMTIERGGYSVLSHFPDDPAAIRRIASDVGEIDLSPRYPGSFVLEAWQDVSYHLASLLGRPAYPFYRRHTPLHPLLDYGAWALRLATRSARARGAAKAQQRLLSADAPFFLVPLQIEGDYQLTAHSPFNTMAAALEVVLRSFAAHAPNEALLVVKSHPNDNGLGRWRRRLDEMALKQRIAGRVVFVDGGSLKDLARTAKGLVTVNSTAGLDALMEDCPVKTLSPALYDMPGLTHQGSLDDFWKASKKPDAALLLDFRKAVAATLLARGSIHNADGLEAAVEAMSSRMLRGDLNEPGGYVDPPPRLARARAIGVPL
ncbi:capsule biosynthesis protein [Stappia albiluteola]|uniref:capsule biosynthesis protein n=1 Tax=Stappia albiluteola TaxID=2758565 RepID=UPI001AD92D4A|nr:capsular biosynthesis protein [Stappia albiluteola]